MKFQKIINGRFLGMTVLMAMVLAPIKATAVVDFDFETDDQFDGNSEISGDLGFWVESTDYNSTASGARSLRFDGSVKEDFRSFTYDVPISLDEGSISVWFYDTVGAGTGSSFEWRMSIILEDADNPADHGAVEIADLPYGSLSYYGSEGSVDRLVAPDTFESGTFGVRSVGWHEVVFDVTPTVTTISVNGNTGVQVAAPGSDVGPLRLRFMADSASAGGFGNWTAAASGFPAEPELVYIDDVTFTATAPTAATDILDFEDSDVSGLGNGSGDPEYDTVAVFMGPPAYNETNMQGFINSFDKSTAQSHSGTNSAAFVNGDPTFKSIVIDLSMASPGTITIPFYDALGQNEDFDKIGAAFIIEDGSDPSNFIAAEIWNAPYPFSETDKNYYFSARPIPFGSGFYSQYFGDRSIGWQTLEIELTNTYSRMTINAVGADAANSNTVYDGPGLNTSPKLRIMADSPTMGGFNNWQDNTGWTDSSTPELDALYFDKGASYLYLDDVSVPLPAASGIEDWAIFE